MPQRFSTRIFAAAGSVYALASLAGSGGGGNSPDIGASAQAIAAYAAGHGVKATAALEEFGLCALLIFTAALAARARSSVGPWSELVLAGGLIAVTVKLVSFGAAFALYSHRQPLQPDVARALYEMNWFGFVAGFLGQGMLLVAVAGAGFEIGAVPKWLAALAAVIGVALLADGLLGLTGGFMPVLELAWIAWALVAGIALAARPGDPAPALRPSTALPA